MTLHCVIESIEGEHPRQLQRSGAIPERSINQAEGTAHARRPIRKVLSKRSDWRVREGQYSG